MSEETISLLGDAGIDRMTTGEGQTPVHDDDPPARGQHNDGDFAGDTPEEPEPLSPEAVKARRSLVRRIARYKTIFPEEVSELGSELEGLIHKSPEELAALLEEVHFLVETRRSSAQARHVFLAGLTMGEAAGPFVGLKLQGLTQVASQSSDLLTTVDEISLRYQSETRIDPVARLAMCVGQLALAVDGANRAREAGAVQAQQPTTPVAEPTNIKTRDMFSDL